MEDKGKDIFISDNNLPESCEYPQPETKLTNLENLSLSPEAGIRKLITRLASKFSLPKFTDEEVRESVGSILASFAYYSATSWEKIPELFYKKPEKVPLACISKPAEIKGGIVRDFLFKTSFKSTYQEYENRRVNKEQDNTVKVREWKHIDIESCGRIVAIHGWMLGDDKSRALTMIPGIFYRMGLDVISIELPLHGSRSPARLTPLNLFPSIDPAVTNESFAQAIYELRAIKIWLQEQSDKPIIPVGLSLGAHTAALWASLDNLDAVVCAAPLSSMPHIIWSNVENTPMGDIIKNAGISFNLLRRVFAVSSPLSYQPRLDPDKRLIITSQHDPIIPAIQGVLLNQHWAGSQIHELKDGHIEQLVEPSSIIAVHKFLAKNGFALSELMDLNA